MIFLSLVHLIINFLISMQCLADYIYTKHSSSNSLTFYNALIYFEYNSEEIMMDLPLIAALCPRSENLGYAIRK